MSDDLKRLEQSVKAKRMNLAEWRKTRTHELTLPSGLGVVVRDVDMTDILITGELPPSVLDIMDEASKTEDAVDLQEIGISMMKDSAEEFATLLNAIVLATLVDPKIGEVSDDDHIALDEIPFSDKNAIMEWVNRGADSLQSFREEEDESLETV